MDFPIVLAALNRQLDYLYATLAILEPPWTLLESCLPQGCFKLLY